MAPNTVRTDVAKALENLSKSDFERFCFHLTDREEVPLNKVEDKSRLQIADVIVSHFTEGGALQVVMDILNKIGCLAEAQKLERNAGGLSPRPGPSDASGGAAGRSKPADGKHFVDKHKLELVRRVCNISSILDELFDRDVISSEVYDTVQNKATAQDKMREIYKKMNSQRAKDIFYEVLLGNEKFLMEELQNK